jgi:hypothetical protein
MNVAERGRRNRWASRVQETAEWACVRPPGSSQTLTVEKGEDAVSGKCKKCGRDLELPPTGRPPDYCSKGCRRAVEYELRRIQRRLEAAELKEAHFRRESDPDSAVYGGSRAHMRKQHGWYVAEVDRLERRLRELLSD